MSCSYSEKRYLIDKNLHQLLQFIYNSNGRLMCSSIKRPVVLAYPMALLCYLALLARTQAGQLDKITHALNTSFSKSNEMPTLYVWL